LHFPLSREVIEKGVSVEEAVKIVAKESPLSFEHGEKIDDMV